MTNQTYTDEQTPDAEETMKLLLTIGIICGVLGVLFMISVCCLFHSLKVAIDVIDASADFLAKTKRIIILPVFYFIINLIVVLLWISAFTAVTTLSVDKIEALVLPNTPHQGKKITFTEDQAV